MGWQTRVLILGLSYAGVTLSKALKFSLSFLTSEGTPVAAAVIRVELEGDRGRIALDTSGYTSPTESLTRGAHGGEAVVLVVVVLTLTG